MNDQNQRIILVDDASDLAFEQEAQKKRETAFQAAHEWHKMPLNWTSSKKMRYLWLQLPTAKLADETLKAIQEAQANPKDDALKRRSDELFARDTAGDNSHHYNAGIVLYLAAHESSAWRSFAHDKERFMEEVERWIADNVGMDEVFGLAEVTNRLLEDAESTRAVPRPSHRSDDEGN